MFEFWFQLPLLFFIVVQYRYALLLIALFSNLWRFFKKLMPIKCPDETYNTQSQIVDSIPVGDVSMSCPQNFINTSICTQYYFGNMIKVSQIRNYKHNHYKWSE